LVCVLTCTGCMRFTERDYELQEQAYQREREQKERQQQDRWGFEW